MGASLGRDSIRDGIRASIAAVAFIALFMLAYYRLSGLNAVVALAANLLIVLAALAYFKATLTLPGIAGIILTVGVGVDTNVLVFERIREELRTGKTVRMAIQNGFDRVLTTILDTHVTGLIAAAILFQFGTGPIKGFAVTVVIGLVANVFASYFVSKLPLRVGPRQAPRREAEHLGGGHGDPQEPALRLPRPGEVPRSSSASSSSRPASTPIAGGHLRYGVEFSGGTQLILQFQSAARGRPDPRRGRDGLAGLRHPDLRRAGGQQGPHPPRRRGRRRRTSTRPARTALATLAESYGDNPVIESSSEIVGPIVGAELRRKAVLLVTLGLLFQLIYLAVRFKGGIWGLAAAVAALHDVIVALGGPDLLRLRDHAQRDRRPAHPGRATASTTPSSSSTAPGRTSGSGRKKLSMTQLLNDSHQPDAQPDPHHQRDHVPRACSGLYLLGRRRPARLQLHPGRGHRRRHLLDDVRRRAAGRLVVSAEAEVVRRLEARPVLAALPAAPEGSPAPLAGPS